MPVLPTLDTTVGLLYDAVVISAVLFGAGCLQGWFYYRKYSGRDPWYLKGLVGFVLFCDVVQMALLTVTVYKYAVTHHGDNASLNVLEETLIIELVFSGAIGLSTQLSLPFRRVLSHFLAVSKSWILVGTVVRSTFFEPSRVFRTGSLCGSPRVYSHRVRTSRSDSHLRIHNRPTPTSCKFLSTACLGTISEYVHQPLAFALDALGAACDLAITVIMVIYLERSKTGFRNVCIANVRTLSCNPISDPFNLGGQASPRPYWHDVRPAVKRIHVFWLTARTVYTNSLLVTLNSRAYIRNGRGSEGTTDRSHDISMIGFGTSAFAPSSSRIANPGHNGPQEIAIRIDTISHQEAGIDSKEYHEDMKEHQSAKVAV
ncbi:hypothetical protein CPB85DRAFT_1475922 [Mucidula mucida]|nr:hypothetical protein CPB85DRAFT_1475922 [Mucidula mucida]